MIEQLVSFTLNSEEFAIDIMKVREIIRIPDITRVPNAPDVVDGVINLRGIIIPVVSIQRVFNLPMSEDTELSRIIVVQEGNEVVGIKVDSVSEVMNLDSASIEPPPPLVMANHKFFRGIGKRGGRLIILIDLNDIASLGNF